MYLKRQELKLQFCQVSFFHAAVHEAGSQTCPLGWAVFPLKSLWEYRWQGKRRTWDSNHVYFWGSVSTRTSSVSGVSFCLALMKEFMFNSSTQPTAHSPYCVCTSPSLSFPLSLHTGLFTPSTLWLPIPGVSPSISLTKKESFINQGKALLTTDLS